MVGDNSFSRGGFMDSTFQGTDSAGPETGRPGDKDSCLMPAWIHTVESSSLGSLQTYAGVTVNLVVIYGIVKSIEQSTTKVTMQVEDETGTIKVVTFLAPDDQESTGPGGKRRAGAIPADVDVGHPVLVYGKPREEEPGKNYILSTFMCSLTDNYPKAFCHLIKIMLVRQRYLKHKSPSGTAHKMLSSAQNEEDYEAPTAGYCTELTRQQKIILDLVLNANDTVHGISRDEVKKLVPAAILPKVDEVLGFLVSEGHIYSTVTEDHFKTT